MAEIDTTQELSRADVASYLREFADQLDAKETRTGTHGETAGRTAGGTNTTSTTTTDTSTNRSDETTHESPATESQEDHDESTVDHAQKYDRVTFFVGNDSTTINPPETVTFEVAVDSDSAMLTSANRRSVDFHLEWDTDVVDDESGLHIE